ncbi:hypothetical protein ACQ86N_11275 [Puia sp. P3]|uniref:hypothetical protein n=1 Tax=Puia sp. P3 TaxID=3423952 RepID=UPI003D67A345
MKNTTHYSGSDIQRYLNGEMSAREMFDLEKAALEDPFLADAIEGYEAHPTAAGDLGELHARLNTRATGPAKTQPLTPGKIRLLIPWRRISVAAVLFIGLGFSAWYFLINTRSGQPTVATQKVGTPTGRTCESRLSRSLDRVRRGRQRIRRTRRNATSRNNQTRQNPQTIARHKTKGPYLLTTHQTGAPI